MPNSFFNCTTKYEFRKSFYFFFLNKGFVIFIIKVALAFTKITERYYFLFYIGGGGDISLFITLVPKVFLFVDLTTMETSVEL